MLSIHFESDLRATVQALGWYSTGRDRPLADDIASTAFWYAAEPCSFGVELPALERRLPR